MTRIRMIIGRITFFQSGKRAWYDKSSAISASVLLCCLLSVGMAVSACDVDREYTCSNGRCVAWGKVNNSINDCIDNSDEVALPCRSPMFSCKSNRCILQIWVLDGSNDCLDFSDEIKFIGTSCTSAKNCCFCEDFIPNSVCKAGICQCRPGHYSNQLGNDCPRRVINDSCKLDLDCASVMSNSLCATDADMSRRCQCVSGYYPSNDMKECIKHTQIGDSCSNDSQECHPIAHSICLNQSCECIEGHRQTQDRYFCHLVAIYDWCDRDAQCGVSPSYCSTNRTCACALGYIPTDRNRKCKLRRIGSACATDADCSTAVNNSICSVGKCRCSIEHDLVDKQCIYVTTLQRDVMISAGLLTCVILLVILNVSICLYFALKCAALRDHRKWTPPNLAS